MYSVSKDVCCAVRYVVLAAEIIDFWLWSSDRSPSSNSDVQDRAGWQTFCVFATWPRRTAWCFRGPLFNDCMGQSKSHVLQIG